MLERDVAGCKGISHLEHIVGAYFGEASQIYLIAWLEPVTDPGFGEYVFWVCRISFDLFS